MKDEVHSHTALRVAMRRATHQLFDRPVVFNDPLAVRIVEAQSIDHQEAQRKEMRSGIRGRSLRAFVAARSRFAEDELAKRVGEDRVRQCVILGAGLDTFAYRNPYPGLRIFEVDHPATQKWKRGLLEKAGIAVPESMTFAPVDFERQTAADGLAAVGFDANQMTFVSWLGVTPYLSEEAFTTTTNWLATLLRGSAMVFDYGVDRSLLGFLERRVLDELSRRVAALGEPFRLFRRPEVLEKELRGKGFGTVVDLDAAAINARYFSGRLDSLRVSGNLGRLALAEV